MQPPSFVVYLGVFLFSLMFCVMLHVFIRSRRRLVPKSALSSQSSEIDPSNCLDLIHRQIALVQTFPHPSPQGRQSVDRLGELLRGTILYFPEHKDQLQAFASRLNQVYEDGGLLLMALMDLRKWLGEALPAPGTNR